MLEGLQELVLGERVLSQSLTEPSGACFVVVPGKLLAHVNLSSWCCVRGIQCCGIARAHETVLTEDESTPGERTSSPGEERIVARAGSLN
jgi:hypothetical protein